MDALIRKYMDGELSEEDSNRFLDAMETDPDLVREVRALEEVVELGSSLDTADLSAGFTDRVMDLVGARNFSQVSIRSPSRFGLLPRVASWILAMGLGYFLSQGLFERPGNGLQPDTGEIVTFSEATPGKTSVAGLTMVRLVYSPQQPGVANVQVAGSFPPAKSLGS